MRSRLKYVLIRLSFAFIWLLFIEGGKRSDHYVFFGEFDGVKNYINQNIDINKLSDSQIKTMHWLEIQEDLAWSKYYIYRPKTKLIYTIDN